ncbi:MAG: hypothetical protein WC803_12890 [Sphingomonas sp.]
MTKGDILQGISFASAEKIESALPNKFTDNVRPSEIKSGELSGNLNVVKGYLQSSNFQTGVNGWKFDAVGNLEANSGTFRGSLYATAGNIGGWVIDANGLYYNGSGTPNIRTSATVGSGANGVILDNAGIRVYDAILGVVVNLPSDGSAPTFSSGEINETTFEISTNAVLRTSETAGDGTANSAGVLINNSGFYGMGANQTPATANVRILNDGNAYFTGDISASGISGSDIVGSSITGSTVTGGLVRTAETGRRIEMDSSGITLLSGATAGKYGTFKYGARRYGTGALAKINNTSLRVPFYIMEEQTVGDLHLYNRSAEPTGTAEVGDLAVISGNLALCTTAGTPGVWTTLGMPGAVVSSLSPSISPSVSPSVSQSISPSISPSVS